MGGGIIELAQLKCAQGRHKYFCSVMTNSHLSEVQILRVNDSHHLRTILVPRDTHLHQSKKYFGHAGQVFWVSELPPNAPSVSCLQMGLLFVNTSSSRATQVSGCSCEHTSHRQNCATKVKQCASVKDDTSESHENEPRCPSKTRLATSH